MSFETSLKIVIIIIVILIPLDFDYLVGSFHRLRIWMNCHRCTFENIPGNVRCEMCDTVLQVFGIESNEIPQVARFHTFQDHHNNGREQLKRERPTEDPEKVTKDMKTNKKTKSVEDLMENASSAPCLRSECCVLGTQPLCEFLSDTLKLIADRRRLYPIQMISLDPVKSYFKQIVDGVANWLHAGSRLKFCLIISSGPKRSQSARILEIFEFEIATFINWQSEPEEKVCKFLKAELHSALLKLQIFYDNLAELPRSKQFKIVVHTDLPDSTLGEADPQQMRWQLEEGCASLDASDLDCKEIHRLNWPPEGRGLTPSLSLQAAGTHSTPAYPNNLYNPNNPTGPVSFVLLVRFRQ
jgi:hypothetical protein